MPRARPRILGRRCRGRHVETVRRLYAACAGRRLRDRFRDLRSENQAQPRPGGRLGRNQRRVRRAHEGYGATWPPSTRRSRATAQKSRTSSLTWATRPRADARPIERGRGRISGPRRRSATPDSPPVDLSARRESPSPKSSLFLDRSRALETVGPWSGQCRGKSVEAVEARARRVRARGLRSLSRHELDSRCRVGHPASTIVSTYRTRAYVRGAREAAGDCVELSGLARSLGQTPRTIPEDASEGTGNTALVDVARAPGERQRQRHPRLGRCRTSQVYQAPRRRKDRAELRAYLDRGEALEADEAVAVGDVAGERGDRAERFQRSLTGRLRVLLLGPRRWCRVGQPAVRGQTGNETRNRRVPRGTRSDAGKLRGYPAQGRRSVRSGRDRRGRYRALDGGRGRAAGCPAGNSLLLCAGPPKRQGRPLRVVSRRKQKPSQPQGCRSRRCRRRTWRSCGAGGRGFNKEACRHLTFATSGSRSETLMEFPITGPYTGMTECASGPPSMGGD